jgi:pSer/pThr/pTyr-binding forkhead associated (FHA) protein
MKPMSERASIAQKIARDALSKRQKGEPVSDESILLAHPQELRDDILEQLQRLRLIEMAKNSSPKSDLLQVMEDLSDRADEPILREVLPSKVSRFTIQELPEDSHFRATSQLSDSKIPPIPSGKSTTPLYHPSNRPPMALLQLIHDGQMTTSIYPIMKERFRIGRAEGDVVVPFDLWISSKHAEIQRCRRGETFYWMIRDLKSTNGTFIQTSRAELQHGDELFLGRERYRFLLQEGKTGIAHATKGSGQQWWSNSDRITLGRSASSELKALQTDPYLEPIHAEIARNEEGKWILTDKKSRNGTWCRIDEAELLPQCLFQLGEQRFCFIYEPPAE